MNGTIHTKMSRWCEEHWLRWEALTPEQADRAEALARAPMEAVPENLRGGLVRWIVKGTPPGSFLLAVLNNDLLNAVARVDEENKPYLGGLVKWLYNHTPTGCWGAPDRVTAWQQFATRAAPPVQAAEVPY
jgi:hypothetical protein